MFRWGLTLGVLVALAAGGYLYLRLDDEIRRFAHAELASQYPDLAVSVGGARHEPGQGLSLFDVRLATRGPTGVSAPMIGVRELRLVGDFDLRHVATGKQALRGVELLGARVVATQQPGGGWDLEGLLPLPETGRAPPPVTVTDATLVIRPHPGRGDGRGLTIRHLDLHAEAAPPTTPGGSPRITFRGSSEDSVAQSLRFQGDATPASGAVQCTVETNGLAITDDLLATLPGANPTLLAGLRLDLRVGGKVVVAVPAAGEPVEWDGNLQVAGGRLSHPLLPRPVSDIAVAAHVTDDRLQVTELSARVGEADLSFTGSRDGWSLAAPGVFTWSLRGLTLDEKLYRSLPRILQQLWDRFRPTGAIDVTGSAAFDGMKWRPDVSVTCRGVSFEDHEQFPYRLTGGTGGLRFYDTGDMAVRSRLEVNLLGMGEGRPIRVAGEFHGLPCVGDADAAGLPDPTPPCPLGWIEVRGESLQVTDALLAALPEDAERVARALNVGGEFSVAWRIARPRADQQAQTTTRLTAADCSVKFKHLPYPVSGVTGSLNEKNGRWWFDDLASRGPGGRVLSAVGAVEPPAADGSAPPVLRMRLTGVAAPIDERLHTALPPGAQRAWEELRPRGRIDFTADVFCRIPEPPRIDLAVTPHGDDLSIEPVSFPYRLEKIDGRFVFSDGAVTFDTARAHHGPTRLEGRGAWRPQPGGGWRLELTNLAVDRLDADQDFRRAAPPDLRRVLAKVDPDSSFGLHNGRLVLLKPEEPAAPPVVEWDLEIDFHQADLNGGLRIEDATGSLRVAGRRDAAGPVTVGELRLDTLFWDGLQLTNVRGPFWCNQQQCLLGAAATAQQQAPPRRVTGELYGGAASLNAQVILDEQPRYGAAISFRDVNLERFTSEFMRSETPLTGRADGSLELQGLGATVFGLNGNGAVQVREANLGELSLLGALLKVLRNRAPDKTAFDRCNARFSLQGGHITFDQLDLLGHAINLYGRGEANFNRTLNLAFQTIVGPSAYGAPLLRSFVGQASEQLLTIRVGGSVNDPQVRRETLPLVGNVLRQFQAERRRAADAAANQPASVRR